MWWSAHTTQKVIGSRFAWATPPTIPLELRSVGIGAQPLIDTLSATFAESIDAYLEHVERRRKPSTYAGYTHPRGLLEGLEEAPRSSDTAPEAAPCTRVVVVGPRNGALGPCTRVVVAAQSSQPPACEG